VSAELRLSPAIGPCHNYVDSTGSEKRVTIVVAPIGLERRGEKTVISWACSRGATCRNPECRYSAAFRERSGVPVASGSVE
jgi:hypothetical protein